MQYSYVLQLSDILGKLPKLSATSLQMDITTTRVIQKPIPLTSQCIMWSRSLVNHIYY